MDHNKTEFEYGKWDSPEDTNDVYFQVRSGLWDQARFEKWVRQVQIEEYRDATVTEDM